MRIGVDGRVLAHTRMGVARYVDNVLRELHAFLPEGTELVLFADGDPGGPWPGVEIEVLRPRLPGGDPAWRQLRLAARLARGDIDLIWCPFYSVPLASSVPAVVTIHDVAYLAHPEWFSRKARWAFGLSVPSAWAARAILTPSEFSKREIVRHIGVPAEKIVVTPLAAELEPPDDAARRAVRAWLGFEGPYVLSLGALSPRRRVDLLLEAFAEPELRESELRLVVVGPGLAGEGAFDDRVRALGLGDEQVLRRAWVPEELLPALLAEAALLAYLSEYEGFGLPALEAATLGTPVLAFPEGSLPEVLGEAGVWVEGRDARTLALVLRRRVEAPLDLAAACGRSGLGQASRWAATACVTAPLLSPSLLARQAERRRSA